MQTRPRSFTNIKVVNVGMTEQYAAHLVEAIGNVLRHYDNSNIRLDINTIATLRALKTTTELRIEELK